MSRARPLLYKAVGGTRALLTVNIKVMGRLDDLHAIYTKGINAYLYL